MTNKLAVLISGSYRNFDQVWDKNKAVIETLRVPYEVFFHTWTQNPSPKNSALDLLYKNEFLLSTKKPVLRPYKYEMITEQTLSTNGFHSSIIEDFNESDVCQDFNLSLNQTNFLLQAQINSCGMYLGIEKLKQELSKQRGFHIFFGFKLILNWI